MEWKQVITTAITGVLVAVLSGVAVWYLTFEKAKSEGVEYEISNTGQFGDGPNRLIFANVLIKNSGNIKAEKIDIDIAEANNKDIAEFQIKKSSSLINEKSFKTENKSLRIEINKLLPGESLSAGLLFRGSNKIYLDISGRTNEKIVVKSKKIKPSENNKYYLFIFLSCFAFLAINARNLTKFLFKKYVYFHSPSRNNSAFLMMHSGFEKEASAILESAIKGGECTPYEFANFALCKELEGEPDQANRLLDLARRWASTNREAAFVRFSAFIIHAKRGNEDLASENLEKSIELEKAIKRYCTDSVIASDIINKSDVYSKIFNDTAYKERRLIKKLSKNDAADR